MRGKGQKRRVREEDALLATLKTAREDWLGAKNLFECAADPQLVEYAVYQMEASRRRYMYLLRLAGEET